MLAPGLTGVSMTCQHRHGGLLCGVCTSEICRVLGESDREVSTTLNDWMQCELKSTESDFAVSVTFIDPVIRTHLHLELPLNYVQYVVTHCTENRATTSNNIVHVQRFKGLLKGKA